VTKTIKTSIPSTTRQLYRRLLSKPTYGFKDASLLEVPTKGTVGNLLNSKRIEKPFKLIAMDEPSANRSITAAGNMLTKLNAPHSMPSNSTLQKMLAIY
jgi:hypothetical protein